MSEEFPGTETVAAEAGVGSRQEGTSERVLVSALQKDLDTLETFYSSGGVSAVEPALDVPFERECLLSLYHAITKLPSIESLLSYEEPMLDQTAFMPELQPEGVSAAELQEAVDRLRSCFRKEVRDDELQNALPAARLLLRAALLMNIPCAELGEASAKLQKEEATVSAQNLLAVLSGPIAAVEVERSGDGAVMLDDTLSFSSDADQDKDGEDGEDDEDDEADDLAEEAFSTTASSGDGAAAPLLACVTLVPSDEVLGGEDDEDLGDDTTRFPGDSLVIPGVSGVGGRVISEAEEAELLAAIARHDQKLAALQSRRVVFAEDETDIDDTGGQRDLTDETTLLVEPNAAAADFDDSDEADDSAEPDDLAEEHGHMPTAVPVDPQARSSWRSAGFAFCVAVVVAGMSLPGYLDDKIAKASATLPSSAPAPAAPVAPAPEEAAPPVESAPPASPAAAEWVYCGKDIARDAQSFECGGLSVSPQCPGFLVVRHIGISSVTRVISTCPDGYSLPSSEPDASKAGTYAILLKPRE